MKSETTKELQNRIQKFEEADSYECFSLNWLGDLVGDLLDRVTEISMTNKSETTNDSMILDRMASAIAKQRREDDRRFGLPTPNGDDGAYLPMDMRTARVALKAYQGADQ